MGRRADKTFRSFISAPELDWRPVPKFASDMPEVAQTLSQTRLPFYCCNCQRKRETAYVTENFGPFCRDCLSEVGL